MGIRTTSSVHFQQQYVLGHGYCYARAVSFECHEIHWFSSSHKELLLLHIYIFKTMSLNVRISTKDQMIIIPAICCARRMFCRLFHHINAHKTSNKKATLTPNAIPILAPEERCAPQAGSPGIPQRPALSVKLAEDTEKQLVTTLFIHMPMLKDLVSDSLFLLESYSVQQHSTHSCWYFS